MTTKPQAKKTMRQILEEWLDNAMSTSIMGWSAVDGYKGNEENSELEAGKDYDKYLLEATKATTQAMLDALPDKVQPREDPYTDGWNDYRDKMESAIKKMGGRDE